MKKLFNLILVSLFCLVVTETNAMTVFLDIDNPENLSSVDTYWSGSKSPLDLTQKMPIAVEFPDDGFRYFYITPNTGNFITEIIVTDEDGEVLLEKKGAFKNMQGLQILSAYDYGTVTIKTSDKQPVDSKLTINLKGDPSKVNLYMGGTNIPSLHEGTQVIEYLASQTSSIYVMPVGVYKFYQVLINGEEVKASSTSDESGKISYQYSISRPTDGSTLDITVDYPEVYFDCAINVNEGLKDFITEVNVNETPVSNWSNFKIRMGSKLELVCNTYDYDVDEFIINGVERQFSLGVWETIVEEDININMKGSIIERPNTAYFYTYNWDYIGNESKGFYRYECYRADPTKSIKLQSGENRIKFNQTEVPLSFFVGADYQSDVHVAINGEMQVPNKNGVYTLDIKDGDIIQVALSMEIPEIPTAINSANPVNVNTNIIHSVQGVQMPADAKLPAGLYIKNGKKMMIK